MNTVSHCTQLVTDQVIVTPAHPPPCPSSIPSLYDSTGFLKIMERLTNNSVPSHTDVTSRNEVVSTQTLQGDALTLIYSANLNTAWHTNQAAFSSAPALHSSLSAQAPAKATRGGLTGASVRTAHGEQTGSVRKQEKPLPLYKQSNSEIIAAASSTVSLKQTKIIGEKSTGKLMLSKNPPSSLSARSKAYEVRRTEAFSALRDVARMSEEERAELEVAFSQLEEVAACLVYADGSSQLRPSTVKGKICATQCLQPYGLYFAYPSKNAPGLDYAFIPLNKADDSLFNWCRNQVRNIMSRSRVIVYGGQKLVASVISCYDLLDHSNEWLRWTILDTQVGVYLLDPDHPPESFAGVLDQCGMQLHLDHTESTGQLSADISLLGSVMVQTYQRLQKENLWKIFEKVEVKLIPILGAMDVVGIQINSNKLLEYAKLLKIKISKIEELAYKAAGHKFSINSTAQLRQVLFDELHLDDLCGRKLSKTQVCKLKSTSECVLMQLEGLHPLPRLVLEYRQLCKVNATYITGILPFITEGTLRASWQHTGAATGRLVSLNPNVQAFPKQPISLGIVQESFIVGKEPEEVSIDIREAVESRAGYTFLAADFRSIELRLVAHFSEDNLLMSILNSRKTPDVFVHLASEWLGVDVDKVTPAHRERTKRVVYAVVYGVGKERLAEILNVEPSYARDLTTNFLDKFPGVKNFIIRTIDECKSKGYLVSICGRRRWFPRIKSSNNQLRMHTERQAVNFLVQGSAADICKCGMVEVCQLLAKDHPGARLLLQIHDEMIFEVLDSEVQEVAGILKSSLETLNLLGYALKVPLEIRLTAGKTWSSLTDL